VLLLLSALTVDLMYCSIHTNDDIVKKKKKTARHCSEVYVGTGDSNIKLNIRSIQNSCRIQQYPNHRMVMTSSYKAVRHTRSSG
jgi:hypothetical protein